jgi:hypothetical protein
MAVWFALDQIALLGLIDFVDRVKAAITSNDPRRQKEDLDGMILRKLRMFRDAYERISRESVFYNTFQIEYQDGYLLSKIFNIDKKTNTATLERLRREGFEIETKQSLTILKLKLKEGTNNWIAQ